MLDKSTIAYYSENPQQAFNRYGVSYEQALAAVKADPSVYTGLNKDLLNKDSQHNYQLLRTIVAANPRNLWRAHQPKNIPVDLLLEGLKSEKTWDWILKDIWPAYKNPLFIQKHPDVAELISLYKELQLTPSDCKIAFENWRARDNKHSQNTPIELPCFD